jgi:hypothetical protein
MDTAYKPYALSIFLQRTPVHAPRFAGITVYATQVTTKALQAVKRKGQAAQVSER